MSAGSSQYAASAITHLFQEPRDVSMTALTCHHYQAAIVQPVPFGIGAGVEQKPDGLDLSFPDREMDCRRVPVFGATEAGISFEQPAQGIDVAVFGRREGVPDDTALLGGELWRLDQGPGNTAND
jgi:hypothetical protein